MRKVCLRMNELEKYKIIKDLVDHGGNKNRAAVNLRLTVRQIQRLIKTYKEKGKSGFVHGNRSRKPAKTIDKPISDTIIYLYCTKIKALILNIFMNTL